MSLTNLFKLRVIQFVMRHRPIRRQFNSSSLHFRHTFLPTLPHRITLPSTVHKHFIPHTPLPMLAYRQTRLFSEEGPPPTWEEVNKSALDILAAFDKISAENVSLEAHFINDLGLDSLDIVEIVMAFEDVFDVEITDDELETIFSGQDAVDLVGKKLEIPYPEGTL